MESKKSIFEKVENIRVARRMGVNEFLKETKISRGTYYRMKDDPTSITDKIIYKLVDAFPDYKYKYFTVNGNDLEFKDENDTKKIVNDKELQSLVVKIKDNWSELYLREDFKPFFFYQIAKALNLKIEDIFAAALNKEK